MISSAQKLIKKNPLILMFFPIIFAIEWVFNPAITNMTFSNYLNVTMYIFQPYYFLNIFYFIYYVAKVFISPFLLCLVLMFFYKIYFLEKSISSNIKMYYLKSIIIYSFVYLSFSILFTCLHDVYMYLHVTVFGFNFFTNTGNFGYIYNNFIQSGFPGIFVCFIFSYCVFCIQNGSGLFASFKKTLRVIFTRSILIIILLAFVMTLGDFFITTIRYYTNKNPYNITYTGYDEVFNSFREMYGNLEDPTEYNDSPDYMVDFDSFFEKQKNYENSTDYSFDDETILRESPFSFSERHSPMSFIDPLYIRLLRTIFRSIFITIVFMFSAILVSKPPNPTEENLVTKKELEEYNV